jgi:hypothetical protein
VRRRGSGHRAGLWIDRGCGPRAAGTDRAGHPARALFRRVFDGWRQARGDRLAAPAVELAIAAWEPRAARLLPARADMPRSRFALHIAQKVADEADHFAVGGRDSGLAGHMDQTRVEQLAHECSIEVLEYRRRLGAAPEYCIRAAAVDQRMGGPVRRFSQWIEMPLAETYRMAVSFRRELGVTGGQARRARSANRTVAYGLRGSRGAVSRAVPRVCWPPP